MFTGGSGDDDIEKRLAGLEEVLLQGDIGSATTAAILSDLRYYARTNKLKEEDILPVLRARLVESLTPPMLPDGTSAQALLRSNSSDPTVLFVIGANGMGKTTTIGKLAARLRGEGNLTVMLGACDTYRAAATEQVWKLWLRLLCCAMLKKT